jgi:O-acetyl-ADP-ribose deacetylase (regulator of RNase III)
MVMIEFKEGDILKADAEALVNTVNCVGVMGRGIALQFKNAYPLNFKAYKTACDDEEVKPGQMFIFETGTVTNPKFIINFPTKRHWKDKSRIEDIDNGLEALQSDIQRLDIKSIAVPPLGSGLGGLSWPSVRQRIVTRLSSLSDVKVIVYEPNGGQFINTLTTKFPSMTPGRAALIVLMNKYLEGLMDPFVSLLEIHKLMYFMQESGEPLRLDYIKYTYGPYARNLWHVLKTLEGHYIVGYGDGGDDPKKLLELKPGAVAEADKYLVDKRETRDNLDRVEKLVAGFETPSGLELLSTVHWVLKHEKEVLSNQEVVTKVYAWGRRKKKFTPNQILLARDTLREQGWVSV